MFGVDLNPVNLAATAMFGPLGGIASQLITQIASQIGQQIIQQLGDELGLPQSSIDMAQGAFAGSMGDTQGAQLNLQEAIEALGQEFGGSPAEVGDFQRMVDDAVNSLVADLGKSEDERAAGGGRGRGAGGAGGAGGTGGAGASSIGSSGGGGWLMAIATALGEKLDEMADEMSGMAEQLSKDDPSLTAKFSALSQQFSMMFNATSTAIKTIGEAMANTARKQ